MTLWDGLNIANSSEENESTLCSQDIEKFVQRYYELINQKCYFEAHSYQSIRFSKKMTIERLREIWSNNNSLVTKDISVVYNSRFEAKVSFRLLANDTDKSTGKAATTPWIMNVKLVFENDQWKYDEAAYERDTAIHAAAYEGDTSKLIELLKNEPEIIEAQNDKGDTPLLLSVYRGHLEAAEFLISQGADINAQNNHGDTPLHLASWKDYKPLVEMLLSVNADTDSRNKDGCAPSDVTQSEEIKQLISQTGDLN